VGREIDTHLLKDLVTVRRNRDSYQSARRRRGFDDLILDRLRIGHCVIFRRASERG